MEAVPFPTLQPISSCDDDPGISPFPVPTSVDDLDIPNSVDDLDIPTSVDDLDIPIALRKGTRTRSKHPYPLSNFVSYSRLSPSHKAFVSSLSSVSIPNCVQEALSSPKWKSAMVEEMRAL